MPVENVVLASALSTIGTLVFLPVVVAALTAAATMLVTRVGEATNRRRDRYAQSVQALVAWSEFPYRVRRRMDDKPATLTALGDRGHTLQERLACHEAWIATDHPALAKAYRQTRAAVAAAVGPWITEAWESPPIGKPSEMNLGDWGPGPELKQAITDLQHQIEGRFGFRRLKVWPKTAARS